MKKLCLLILLILILTSYVNAQIMPTFDAALNTLMSITALEQAIHYAQTVDEYVQTAFRFEQQVQQWIIEGERYAKQLASITDVNSFDEFMSWYNRSLSAEQRLMNFINSPNIQIGRNRYSWRDIDQIGADISSDLKWHDEFTEEQRKEMWLNLGLTPANYAYVQPYRLKANELAYEMLASRGAVDSWLAQNLEETYMRQRKLKEDELKAEADKLTDKELLMMIMSALNEQNVTMGMMAEMQAQVLEAQALERKLNDDSPNFVKPPITKTPSNVFRPLDDPLMGAN